MDSPDTVEHFFGVYLLYCTNPKYKGRTYIGYTVNPVRRVKQHNAGKKFGGAWKTSNRGPWNMVLIAHGFPNATSALRFEWAWQHPHASRRLRHVPRKKPRQKVFEYYLLVLSEMLQTGPWCRLPLTIRWLDYEFSKDYTCLLSPPMHMRVCFGPVTSQKLKNSASKTRDHREEVDESILGSYGTCSICELSVDQRDRINCIRPSCELVAHLVCLAKSFLKDSDSLLPITGTCPVCGTNVLWGDLIRKKIGCNLHLRENSDSSDLESTDSSE